MGQNPTTRHTPGETPAPLADLADLAPNSVQFQTLTAFLHYYMLSAFDIFEIPLVSMKLVSFLYDTNFAMIGRGVSLCLLVCPSRCTLYTVYHYVGDRFRVHLLLKRDLFPIIIVFFIFFHTINKNIFSSCAWFLSVRFKQSDLFSQPYHCVAIPFLL